MECSPVITQLDPPRSPLAILIELLATAVQAQLREQDRVISPDFRPEKSQQIFENPVDSTASQSVYAPHQTGKAP